MLETFLCTSGLKDCNGQGQGMAYRLAAQTLSFLAPRSVEGKTGWNLHSFEITDMLELGR